MLFLIHWMLFASSSKFCLRRFLFFTTSRRYGFQHHSLFFKSVVIVFYQCFRSSNSYVAHLLSRDIESNINFAFLAGFQAIYFVDQLAPKDRRLCFWNECTLTIGSFFSVPYRVMEHAGSLESTERSVRVARAIAEGNSSFLSALQTSQGLHNSVVHS